MRPMVGAIGERIRSDPISTAGSRQPRSCGADTVEFEWGMGMNSDRGSNRKAATLAVALVSMGMLVVEISLTRILSFALWYHFTYVVIAVALLGYGASGALLASSDRLARMEPARLISGVCLIGAFAASLALLAIRFIAFQPLEVGGDPVQLFLMTVYLLTIMMPFLCAGLVISVTLRHWAKYTTVIYLADLVGAGCGCALAILAIWILGAPGGVAAGAWLMGLAAVLMARPASRRVVVIAAIAAGLSASGVVASVSFRPSADKFLATAMSNGVVPLLTRWSPIFRVDVYEAGDPGRRFGTSARFRGTFPPGRFIAHDGGAEAMMYGFEGEPEEIEFLKWNVASAPYQILKRPEVLIIGLGGGFDVLSAISGGASHITGVELDPITVDVVGEHSRDFNGGILHRPDVSAVVSEGRSFLRHHDSKYDLIQLTGVDTLAALSSGAYILAESYLYTVEAIHDYFDSLSDDGILSFLFRDLDWRENRARFSLRQMANFAAAARGLGISDPAAHTVVIALPGMIPSLEIMFKKTPFKPRQLAQLRRYARERDFEIWAMPGFKAGTPHELLLSGSHEQREEFFESYPLAVRETPDDRPFYFHFFRWSDLMGISGREVDLGHTGATGQIVLGVLLIFSILASVALILVPLLVSRRIALGAPGSWHYAVYFGAVGLGFMLVEISLIQRFVLFLGHPTYSIATILAALLVSTGIGSFVSGRIPVEPRRLLVPALAMAVAIAGGYLFALPPVFSALLGAPLGARVALAVLLLIPLGLTLGVFFPSGLRIVNEHNPDFIPWAWGVNGGASVVASILAIVLAITYGFPVVTAIGLLVYATGVVTMLSAGATRTAEQ
jgi:hypothetical protein